MTYPSIRDEDQLILEVLQQEGGEVLSSNHRLLTELSYKLPARNKEEVCHTVQMSHMSSLKHASIMTLILIQVEVRYNHLLSLVCQELEDGSDSDSKSNKDVVL